MLKSILKNKTGSAMLLMTLFTLASILTISLSLSAIVVNGLKMGVNQVHSTKAFFAAEAGAERILWEARKENRIDNDPGKGEPGDNCGVNPAWFCFSNNTDGTLDDCVLDCFAAGKFYKQQLANNSTYKIKFDYIIAECATRLKSYGNYNNEINRVIELKYLD
ncbi:MAG: hypothetical protein U9M94_04345 [Patescibacteria group bacterium]|nr:hypothetical protein [Patescibacteria group bacterium]